MASASDPGPTHDLGHVPFWQSLFAVAIIFGVSYLFARPVLDLSSDVVPVSLEFEPNAGLIANAYNAIRHHGEFPFWNPYVATGVPYLGDPAIYLFNPLGSIPGLILGPVNGPKIGILLAVTFSGLSGYYLASVLRLSWPARLWAAVFLAINGHMLARIFGGQYQLAIAFPFMAFALAFFIETLRRREPYYPILAGASVAVLLGSGLLYYFLYTVPALGITLAFYAVESQTEGWRPRRLWPLVRRTAVAALWAGGFAAAVIIPFAQTFDFVQKDFDPFLAHSQTIPDSFLNFLISNDTYYHEANRGMPEGFLHEFYSYVGLVPVLAMPFALFALRRRESRLLVLLIATLLVFYLAWASARHTPFRYAYEQFTFLYNFRWTSRGLAPATLMLVVLGAAGIDELLRASMSLRWPRAPTLRVFGRGALSMAPLAGGALAALFLGLLAYNAYDVFTTNQRLLQLVDRRQNHPALARWFVQEGTQPAYVSLFDGAPGIILPFVERGVLVLDPVYWKPKLKYGVEDNPPPAEQIIHPRAEYIVLVNDAPPDQEDARLVAQLPGRYIYRLEDSPSFASIVYTSDPPLGEEFPWDEPHEPAEATIVSPNVIEVEAEATGELDRVLVLQSYFSGWQVEIDGQDAGAADNLSGFLSTEARPGRHTYRFVFDPAAHRYGLAVSLGTLLGATGVTGAWWVSRRRST